MCRSPRHSLWSAWFISTQLNKLSQSVPAAQVLKIFEYFQLNWFRCCVVTNPTYKNAFCANYFFQIEKSFILQYRLRKCYLCLATCDVLFLILHDIFYGPQSCNGLKIILVQVLVRSTLFKDGGLSVFHGFTQIHTEYTKGTKPESLTEE